VYDPHYGATRSLPVRGGLEGVAAGGFLLYQVTRCLSPLARAHTGVVLLTDTVSSVTKADLSQQGYRERRGAVVLVGPAPGSDRLACRRVSNLPLGSQLYSSLVGMSIIKAL
jgi:hypothetical protein